jgi:hypothetical protein
MTVSRLPSFRRRLLSFTSLSRFTPPLAWSIRMLMEARRRFVACSGGVRTPRLGIDVLIDRNTGLLRTDRGISLFADPAAVERFGGAYRLESIPAALTMQPRGRDPGHYELMPAEPMSFERYVELLQQVVLRPVQGE